MLWFIAAKAFLGGVPRWVWIALAAVAVLTAGVVWHKHRAHAAIQAAVKAEDAVWVQRLADERKRAVAARSEAEAAHAAMSDMERKQHEQVIRSNAAAASALLVRGAGAARCRPLDNPGAATSPGGHNQSAPITDAARSQMPTGDWALVPWDWLVKRAQEHDDVLDEDRTWRTNDAHQREAWEKMRKDHP